MTLIDFPTPKEAWVKPKTLENWPWDMELGKPHGDINGSVANPPEQEVNDLARYKEGVCHRADRIVNGIRGEVHGDMVEQHKLAARLWTAYKGVEFTAEEVATCMELLKISRAKCGSPDMDHYIDRAGYAEVAWECRDAGC
jgi:hypothetical protein